jgi:hypothetical protein
MIKKLFIASLILLFTSSNAQTSVSGGIYNNTTWTLANSPYIVTGNLALFPGDTLKIQPGVVVKFNINTNFDVRGVLISIGTVADSILFTSASPSPTIGIWQGVNINNNLGGSASIKYSTFKYASVALANVCCNAAGPLKVSHCLFTHNAVAFGGYSGTAVPVDSCIFSNNFHAIEHGDKTITNSIFKNNSYGLYETERISVYDSKFCSNGIALHGGRGNLQNCTIMNNGIGVKPFYEGFYNVSGNIIAQNDTGLVLGDYNNGSSSSSPGLGSNNKICDNVYYNLMNLTQLNINVANNCWCETVATNISTKIYDGYDNINYGLITFSPYLTSCSSSSLPSQPCSANTVMGINSLESLDFGLLVFPNPSTNLITIQSQINLGSIIIYNSIGKEVYKVQSKSSLEHIDISELSSGIYIICVQHNYIKLIKE